MRTWVWNNILYCSFTLPLILWNKDFLIPNNFCVLFIIFMIRKVYLALVQTVKIIFKDASQSKSHVRNLSGGNTQHSTRTGTALWRRAFRLFWIRLWFLKNVKLSGLMVHLCVRYLCLCTPVGHLSLILQNFDSVSHKHTNWASFFCKLIKFLLTTWAIYFKCDKIFILLYQVMTNG